MLKDDGSTALAAYLAFYQAMFEKKKELAEKIALTELTYLERKRGTVETDEEKRKREESEREKEKIKDSLEWEIEKSELAKKWENNEIDRLHYYALIGDAASLSQRIEERKKDFQEQAQKEAKKADKMDIENSKQKEEEGKEKTGMTYLVLICTRKR